MRNMAIAKPFLLGVIMLSFFVVGVLAPFSMIEMDHQDHEVGKKSYCHFMLGTAEVCAMDALDHIVLWQSAFTAPPVQFLSILVYLLLCLFTFLLVRFFRGFSRKPKKSSRLSHWTHSVAILKFSSFLIGTTINPRAP